MMNRKTGAALAGVLAIAAMASQAQAQTAATAPPVATGPAIPGMCVLSREGLVAGSTVGKFVQSRLSQLAQAADAEVTAQQTSLENDAKALDAQRGSLSSDQLNQRAAALQARQQNIERLVQARRQEMSATQQKALTRVLTEADPLVRQAFQQHNCTILIDAQSVIFAAPAMDLTAGVVAGLNAKITQFTFDREQGAAAQ